VTHPALYTLTSGNSKCIGSRVEASVRTWEKRYGGLVTPDGTVRMVSCHSLVWKVLHANLHHVLLEHCPSWGLWLKMYLFEVLCTCETILSSQTVSNTIGLKARALQACFSISTLLRPSQRLPLAERTQAPFPLHRRGTTLL
jgi:hypothetical protein